MTINTFILLVALFCVVYWGVSHWYDNRHARPPKRYTSRGTRWPRE
jgi:hypothetical protein